MRNESKIICISRTYLYRIEWSMCCTIVGNGWITRFRSVNLTWCAQVQKRNNRRTPFHFEWNASRNQLGDYWLDNTITLSVNRIIRAGLGRFSIRRWLMNKRTNMLRVVLGINSNLEDNKTGTLFCVLNNKLMLSRVHVREMLRDR